jgi:myosin heavy subunit/WD40 repeat protein
MATTYAQGTLIWIKHEEEVWMQAEIVSSGEKEIIVKTSEDNDARIRLAPNEPIFLRSSDVFTTEGLSVLDDLTQLTYLHEPAVLSSLQNRFDIDKIYTFTGPILIALNPFKPVPGLYNEEVLRSFITTQPSGKPHVFNTSNSAYRGICDRQKCQTVLISGESGAGKTETTKHVMKFLAMAGAADGEITNVEKQVLESNPMLEAFGNARTLRNDNSSRFGKFIVLQFQSVGGITTPGLAGGRSRLCGAKVQTYLLEKVRVVDHQEGERNYHIFYEACASALTLKEGTIYHYPQKLKKDKILEEYSFDLDGFSALSNYTYLTRSSCVTLNGVDDVEMFERRIHAMQTIGISNAHIQDIFKVIAAVLQLGNTKFDAPPSNSEGSTVMKECAQAFDCVARLTGVERKSLESALCTSVRVTRTEKIRSPVNVRQASDNRDALARALFGLVFNFVVRMANESIGYRTDVKLFCGVLDIFGFEQFKMNSFEQLCINFTNERLQQFFNLFVFKLEEQLYEREGIPWDPLDFPDNQDAVDLLQGKPSGIFAMLDEECVVPGGSDKAFCNKILRTHKGHRRMDEIKMKPTWFVIKHFAGPVQYCTDSFLDKNKDQLSDGTIECMGSSTSAFISDLFRSDIKYMAVFAEKDESQKKKKKYTVSSEFKEQLSSLMEIVDTTEPHFIRCIKPNPQNVPDLYDRKGVTEQLRYGGVLQVVQVSRAGYPVRINHQECWDDYKVIGTPSVIAGLKHLSDTTARAKQLLEHLAKELNIDPKLGITWAVGKTLVFFKQFVYERLKFARLELLIKSTTLIQACWRRRTARQMYKAVRVFTRHVQSLLRGREARQDLMLLRQEVCATRIQALARKHRHQKSYANVRKNIVRIQSWRKGVVGRRGFKDLKLYVAARKIQSFYRRREEERVYKVLKRSIQLTQQRWRMHFAKSQMKKLKQEAKEVGALMAKSQKAHEQATELRKRNEELEAVQLQLQSERKTLQGKLESSEKMLAEMGSQMEDLKKANDEAAKTVNDPSKVVIESQEFQKLQKDLTEKDDLCQRLESELAALKKVCATQQETISEAESRYQHLLKSTAVQSLANVGGASVARAPSTRAAKTNRNVDIQLIGAPGVGKTSLLEHLIREHDPEQMQRFLDNKPNLMSHHQIQVNDRLLKVLDCSSNSRAQHLVKEWFGRSHWVFVIYDMAQPKTLEIALDIIKDVKAAGARVVLFGNKWSVDHGQQVQVDVMAAKDCAVRNEAMAVESSKLIEGVRIIANAADDFTDGDVASHPAEGLAPDGAKRTTISAAIDSVRSWIGGANDRGGKATGGVLRPSLKGTKAMKQARREGDVNADLRPVQELQDSESAVTCICFGQERQHRAYVLLATASKDGTVVIYRCYRTEMEVAMASDMDFPQDDDPVFNKPPADNTNIAVHSRLVGHSRAITSIFFNLLEDQLVTTSIDKSVRFWGVESGEMLKVFTDSSPVPVASFLPFNPQVFVAANSNAVLRLVNVQNGMVLQKLKVETEVRALKFDDTGLFLLAGTKNGSIHVLEATDSSTLKFKFKVQLARGGVTCITFVPACNGQPACLLVNTSDSSATIIDCTYGPPAGVLTNLAVRHRVRVAHSLLPLKCCYSPSGQGYLISGSEDKEVYIYSLAKGSNYKMQYLKHHQVPVVAVAVNLQDTLLASADSLGRIVMWRRMDFSHITE